MVVAGQVLTRSDKAGSRSLVSGPEVGKDRALEHAA